MHIGLILDYVWHPSRSLISVYEWSVEQFKINTLINLKAFWDPPYRNLLSTLLQVQTLRTDAGASLLPL